MAVFHSIADLLLHERKRMAAIKGTVEHRFDTMVEFSREDHLILTSGTIPKKLIDKVHPYARGGTAGMRGFGKYTQDAARHGASMQFRGKTMQLNPWPINKHRANGLQSTLKKVGPTSAGVQRKARIFFAAPFAKYLLSYGGTRLMVARGVLGPDGQITKRWKARLHGAGKDIQTQIQGNG